MLCNLDAMASRVQKTSNMFLQPDLFPITKIDCFVKTIAWKLEAFNEQPWDANIVKHRVYNPDWASREH